MHRSERSAAAGQWRTVSIGRAKRGRCWCVRCWASRLSRPVRDGERCCDADTRSRPQKPRRGAVNGLIEALVTQRNSHVIGVR